jgi:GNAT superfamily N-acetyltransferase
MFVRAWSFTPRPERAPDFQRAYAADGEWAELFRRSPAYLGTDLERIDNSGASYLTIDRWHSAEAWTAFLVAHRSDYDALDERCTPLLEAEREIATLRRAQAEDAAAIAILTDELGYPNTVDDIGARLAVISAGEDEVLLVADAPGRPAAGWMHVLGARRLESPPYAEVGGLVVGASARGRHVGAALLRTGELWARDRGFDHLLIRSNVLRTGAHAFYERHGYTTPKFQRVFRKQL